MLQQLPGHYPRYAGEQAVKLLDDIIDMAADDKTPIGNLLRKCLILERRVKRNFWHSSTGN